MVKRKTKKANKPTRKSKNKYPSHNNDIVSLRRIEGQIRGVQKMIEDGRYCVDILTQIESVVGAIQRVEGRILKRHMEGCVAKSMKSRSARDKAKKINEVLELIKRFHKK